MHVSSLPDRLYTVRLRLRPRFGFVTHNMQVDPSTPVKQGAPVCVVAKTLVAWTINPLKVGGVIILIRWVYEKTEYS